MSRIPAPRLRLARVRVAAPGTVRRRLRIETGSALILALLLAGALSLGWLTVAALQLLGVL